MEDKKAKLRQYVKRATAIILMLLCLGFTMNTLQYYLSIPPDMDQVRAIQFRKEPKNSIDVIMLGSSPTYSGFSSAYAYEKYGFTSYPFAFAGSYCSMWKPAMQCVLLTQKPKLVVVDVFGGGYDIETGENRKFSLYLISNSMPYSVQKFRMAREASKHMDTGDSISLAFPFIRYHLNFPTNLKKIEDRLSIERYGPSPLKGVEFITRAEKLKPQESEAFTSDTEALNIKTENLIKDFIKYCRSQNIDLLFVKYPCRLTYEEDFLANMRQNSVLELAAEEGCDVLDLQKNFYDIGLDEKTDFYNRSHTNHRGQRKITDYLASYIQETKGIEPSELNQDLRNDWNKAAEYYEALCEMSEELIISDDEQLLSDYPTTIEQIEQYLKEKNE